MESPEGETTNSYQRLFGGEADVTSVFLSTTETDLPIVSPQKPLHKLIGIVLTLIAAFAFALSSLVTKVIIERYDPFMIAFVRGQGILIPSLVFLLYATYYKKKNIFGSLLPITSKENQWTVVAVIGRGILGSIFTIALTFAIKFISIGDTIVLKSCAPLMVLFFASCCLNESLGITPLLCGIQIIAGVVCIAKPPFMTGEVDYNVDTLVGTILGLTVAVAGSLGIICMRYSRKLHFSIVTLSMGGIDTFCTAIICIGVGGFRCPSSLIDYLFLLTIGVCSAVTQILTFVALKFNTAGLTSIIRTSEVLFGFLLEVCILKYNPDKLSIIGAVIVVLAVLIMGTNKKD